MKLLVVTSHYLPSQGGYQHLTHQTLLCLERIGVSITLVAPIYLDLDNKDSEIPYEVIRYSTPNYIGGVYRIFKVNELWKTGKYDAVVLHGHYDETGYGIFHRFLSFTPITRTAGTRIHFEAPFWKRFLGYNILGATYKNSRFLLSSTQFTKNMIQNHIDIDDKMFTIVTEPFDDAIWGEQRKKKNNKVFKMMTVARFEKLKNIRDVLFVLKELVNDGYDIKYDVIGEGEEKENLEELVKEFDLENVVSFLGRVDQEKLPEYYANADLFILLSHSETFGRVYVEAFSQGTPVIGNAVGGVSEVIDHEENGFLVEKGDLDAVKNNIIKLLEDKKLKKQLGENARNKYNSLYSGKVVGDILKEALEKII